MVYGPREGGVVSSTSASLCVLSLALSLLVPLLLSILPESFDFEQVLMDLSASML
jgi:hypothetical protein